MLSLLGRQEDHSWTLAKGVPSKAVLNWQRKVLRWASDAEKQRLLKFLTAELASASDDIKDEFSNGQVTSDISRCFLCGSEQVQIVAAEALAVLCDKNPANCAVTVAANCRPSLGAQPRRLLGHACSILLQANNMNLHLALAATRLLRKVAGWEASTMVEQLQQTVLLSKLVQLVASWSAVTVQDSTPAVYCKHILQMLPELLDLLQCLASAGDRAKCRDLFSAATVKLLLDVVDQQRGQGAQVACTGISCSAAVIREAMNLLWILFLNVPAHRMKFCDMDGVSRLLRTLRDPTLPWSVRLPTVNALTAASSSPGVAQEIILKGLVCLRQMVATHAQRMSSSTDLAAAGPSTPTYPPRPSTGPRSVREPCNAVVAQRLLELLDVVTAVSHSQALLEAEEFNALLTALSSGIKHFTICDGYRVASAAAQVLYRLSMGPQVGDALAPELASPALTDTLLHLISWAGKHAAVSTPRDALILYGGWCAAGILVKVMACKRREGAEREGHMLAQGSMMKPVVNLLAVSSPALMVALGVPLAEANSSGQDPGPSSSQRSSAASEVPAEGQAYLSDRRMVEDMRNAVIELLRLLEELAGQGPVIQQALGEMHVVDVLLRLAPCKVVQGHVKQVLYKLGHLGVEYQPFLKYGSGPLLEAVLHAVRLDPAPFLERGLDAETLLQMKDRELQQNLGLDGIGLTRMARIREAHGLFVAIDSATGPEDGCITISDMKMFLEGREHMRAWDVETICTGACDWLKVLQDDPLSFISFLELFSWLKSKLQSFVLPQTWDQWRGGGGAAAVADPALSSFFARAAKRCRVDQSSNW